MGKSGNANLSSTDDLEFDFYVGDSSRSKLDLKDSKKKSNKRKPNKFVVVLALLVSILMVVAFGAYSFLTRDIQSERERVLVQSDSVKNAIQSYELSVMPFMLECISYNKTRDLAYDTTLSAIKEFELSKRDYTAYSKLKEQVDSFISYSKTIDGLSDIQSYKSKLKTLSVNEELVDKSVKNYNTVLDEYTKFLSSTKYKFIWSSKEFSIIGK
jgi:hypothetical protein